MKTILFETEEPISRRHAGRGRDARPTPPRNPPLRSKVLTGREYTKAVNRDRIKAAARQLFTELDYENATVRAIAARAGVALGTVSHYAKDKRDLILLAYNDEVESMIAQGAELIRERAGFDENLLAFFRVFYEGYAANLQLARTYLEVNFFAFGMNSKGLAVNRQRKLDAVKRIVRLGQERHELRTDIKPEVIAMQFLFLHSSAVRSWILEEHPNVRGGLAEMRKLIELQTQGLGSVRRR